MESLNVLLSKLNEAQLKPVLDTEGAVLVIAGAGSGKTRVLTSRIAYLIAEKKVRPENVMAITFTNKAAGEMKERIQSLVGDISDMWVSTIHSMCVRILRSEIHRIGYDTNFSIYDETDKDKVLKRVFQDLGYDQDKLLKTIKNHISIAKNEGLTPFEYKNANLELKIIDEITEVYCAYDKQLAQANALDFDDLIFKTYQLFNEYPMVAKFYSDRFQYIHIDEFQDTNGVQFAIAKSLAKSHGNIFVVGDDDQSIYGWRGAKLDNILSFDEIFTGAKIYKLEQNYRSTKKILQLANCIISNNTSRRKKELWTDNDEGVRIETFVGNDENDEATFTALQIKNILARNTQLNYKDFAVFMRINALSRAYEQEFMKYGIPCKIYGGFRFFERKEIKDLLAYLRLINNPKDDEAFLRSIQCPKRGIGDKTLRELREFSTSLGVSLYECLDRLDETSILGATRKKLLNFKALISSYDAYSKVNKVVDLLDYVIETTSFYDQFEEKSEENTSKLHNISELKNSAEQFQNDNAGSSLSDYLNSVTLSSDTDDLNTDNAVTIATIHAAKGLEYKVVFVVGLDEKILPIGRSLADFDELEEERRLMYVAVTRAKERLYLTRAMSRYLYGNREHMLQSRFLKEAQPVLRPVTKDETTYVKAESHVKNGFLPFDDEKVLSGCGYSSNYAKTFLQGNKPKAKMTIDFSNYKRGAKVNHAKFGEGTIIDVKGEGETMLVHVAFKGVGIKILAAKFAPMEIV